MDAREILVANTKTQKRYKLTTAATTLSELKAAMDAENIDYEGMTFTEGISKIQLLDDATQLPQNVMYHGEPTNNLVILLTNTKKNIASGGESRQEAFDYIKSHELQDEVKKKFNRLYNMVSTAELWEFINNYNVGTSEETKDEKNTAHTAPLTTSDTSDVLNSIYNCIKALYDLDVVSHAGLQSFINKLLDIVEEDDDYVYYTESEVGYQPLSTSDGKISDDDVDVMLDDLGF